MNHTVTSKEAILDAGVHIAAERGIEALNIRDVAKRCGISVGCVYRYFPSKAALLTATVGTVWETIFHEAHGAAPGEGFRECVARVYECARCGSEDYPSFFAMHPAGFTSNEKSEGHAAMTRYLDHIRSGMLAALNDDREVRPDAFDKSFTREGLVAFIFDNILSFAAAERPDCGYLIRLLDRLIY